MDDRVRQIQVIAGVVNTEIHHSNTICQCGHHMAHRLEDFSVLDLTHGLYSLRTQVLLEWAAPT
jgi:hypothetical protein